MSGGPTADDTETSLEGLEIVHGGAGEFWGRGRRESGGAGGQWEKVASCFEKTTETGSHIRVCVYRSGFVCIGRGNFIWGREKNVFFNLRFDQDSSSFKDRIFEMVVEKRDKGIVPFLESSFGLSLPSTMHLSRLC